MRNILLAILIITSINCFGQEKYWEQLNQTEKNKILNNPDVVPYALKFFKGNYDLNQDSLVLDFLDKISLNKSKELLPFYYFLFIKMCKEADGYIGETLGDCCINFLLNHSNFVLKHIRQEIKNGRNDEYNYFKDNMIFEYYASDLESSYPNRPNYNDFVKILETKTNNENKILLRKLMKEVKLGALKMIEEDKK